MTARFIFADCTKPLFNVRIVRIIKRVISPSSPHSIDALVMPCFSHFERLPSSQSNPANFKTKPSNMSIQLYVQTYHKSIGDSTRNPSSFGVDIAQKITVRPGPIAPPADQFSIGVDKDAATPSYGAAPASFSPSASPSRRSSHSFRATFSGSIFCFFHHALSSPV